MITAASALIVVAHPDDEALGCGGTVVRLKAAGARVSCCFLCAAARARRNRPEDGVLRRDMEAAADLLGFDQLVYGDFPNIELNTVPHIELVQFIEDAMLEVGADLIVTHHAYDLNNDHHHTSLAAKAAARLWQRRDGVPALAGLLYMETASSTEWAFNGPADRFSPNIYVELDDHALERKLAALAAYRGVMRPYPHPRSEEGLRAQAMRRGMEAGLRHAEAFEAAFIRTNW